MSFIDILKQKGFKLNGFARVIEKQSPLYEKKYPLLYAMAGDDYPISNIISINVTAVAPIIAPRYRLFPDTTEEEQIASSLKTYGLGDRE